MNEAYQKSIEHIVEEYATDVVRGLYEQEAALRLQQNGPNELPKQKTISSFTLFAGQFSNPLMIILIAASLISCALGEWSDGAAVALIVVINAFIGFIQEWKADRAAAALQSLSTPQCHVLREGAMHEIVASQLVVGDCVELASGDRIPADLRLVRAIDCYVDESLLTGEHEPVAKNTNVIHGHATLGDRTNMLFQGTHVLSGRACGIVVAVASETELGKIASQSYTGIETQTFIQKQLNAFSIKLGYFTVSIALFVFVLGYVRGMDLAQICALSIALAVAAMPESLMIALTVILAVGMQRMYKRAALVRKLVAAETLGSVSVICCDKTGTLTEGRLRLMRIATHTHDEVISDTRCTAEAHDILAMALLCSDATHDAGNDKCIGSPIDCALYDAARNASIDPKKVRSDYTRISEIPFSSDRKYMVTLHSQPATTTQRLIMKGAFDYILPLCILSEHEQLLLQARAHEMTQAGLRVLALASKDGDALTLNERSSMQLRALLGFWDGVRKNTAQTIKELSDAGIRTVIVTGDHTKTAHAIALQAGVLVKNHIVMTGEQIELISDQELDSKIETIDLFARVDPFDKVRIVKSWQRAHARVAMIGDGVNDAPALRAADIGIALKSGSDLAHEVADIVLLDNNLHTVAAAVFEGRIIIDNIRKVIVYLLVDSFGEVCLIIGTIIFGLPLPLLPIQILWINLISDGLPYLALTVEPGEPILMNEKPRNISEPIINRDMKIMIVIICLIVDVVLFLLYLFLTSLHMDLAHIRTIIFTTLAITSQLYVFSIRSMRTSIFRMNPFSNRFMVPAVLCGILLQLAVVYVPFLQKFFITVPLGMFDWIIITSLALFKIAVIEITKEARIRLNKHYAA